MGKDFKPEAASAQEVGQRAFEAQRIYRTMGYRLVLEKGEVYLRAGCQDKENRKTVPWGYTHRGKNMKFTGSVTAG